MNGNVLITGVSGMVGSHLVDFILENTSLEIYGLVRWRSPLSNLSNAMRVDRESTDRRFHLRYGDLLDIASLIKVVSEVKPQYVFHLAAQSFPQASFAMPALTYETNISGTSNLLEALKTVVPDCKIHVCSSSEVFGRVSSEKLPIAEDCSFHPASPYAISKVGTDLIGQHYAEAYNMKIAITRMFTHTGPRRGDYFAESSFAKQLALIEVEKQVPIVKVGNLDSLRTVADVRDAVRAYWLLLNCDYTPGDTFNIGGSKVLTVGSILDYLISISATKEVEVLRDFERMRPIDADLQVADTAKFKQLTGWEPEIQFEQTMKDLLDYWRQKVALSPYAYPNR